MVKHLVLLGGLVSAGACRDTPSNICMTVPVPAMTVHAEAAKTGENLDARATLTIIELQAPFDTVSGTISNSPPSLPIAVTADRIGRFKVRIEVQGFVAWEEIVTVADAGGPCHQPQTVDVVARLNAN